MATVRITPRRGGPRSLYLDPSRERDAALIATLRRAAGRDELVSVEVVEEVTQTADVTQAPARKVAAKKAVEAPAEA